VLLTILLDWCVPRRALRWGTVLGYHDTLTRPPPTCPWCYMLGRDTDSHCEDRVCEAWYHYETAVA
jgi:hypothetical protein